MKRYLTEPEKQMLLEKFKTYLENQTSGEISFKDTLKNPDKIKVFYTPEAFSKSVQLIMSHTTEIAWHCLVRRKDKDFEVYDVLCYPQTVGPAHVHVKMGRTFGDGKPKDPTKYYTDWYNDVVLEMPEEEEANLCGQCHSHVNMSTSPSSVDLAQQKEELQLKQSGYYLFQIWNKKLEINSFLYDLDAGILYEGKDIEIIVEDDDFTALSHKMLTEPEPEVKKAEKEEQNKPKNESQKRYTQKDWEKLYKKYQMYNPNRYYDDYYDDYGEYAIPLNKYVIGVAASDNPEINTEYVVEAHNSAEAAELFELWAIAHEDWITDELSVMSKKSVEGIKIMDPVLSFGGENVDLIYEELLGELE